jgi:hypothetical protein
MEFLREGRQGVRGKCVQDQGTPSPWEGIFLEVVAMSFLN